MDTYPIYYRKNGRGVKLISASVAYMITLPPEAVVPLRDITTYPDADRLQRHVAAMDPVNEDTWSEFLFAFYRGIKDEHAKAALIREEKLRKQTNVNL